MLCGSTNSATASTKKKRKKDTKRCENIFGINFSKTWSKCQGQDHEAAITNGGLK